MSRNPATATSLERRIAWYRARDLAGGHGLDPLTADAVARRGAEIGREVRWYETADRLMPLARAAILDADARGGDLASGTVWWAGSLRSAKGRSARQWWAPEGGLYLCIALAPRLLAGHVSLYSLGMGVAVAQVLRQWGSPARLRWVNDVLIDGRKVAGMLAEGGTAPGSGEPYILLGLGLNVNIRTFPPDLPEAVSLCQVTGGPWPLMPLAAHVLARVGWVVGILHHWEALWLDADEGPGLANPVVKAWRELSDTPGRRVRYGLDADLAPEFEAEALDLTPEGYLELRLDDGTLVSVNTGEVRHVR